jgi:transposase InsO family protein
MEWEVKARLKWVELYNQVEDAGYVCRRCGISRPTLRKWLKRFRESGIDGLRERNRRPHHIPNQKITEDLENTILNLRKDRKLGARRIQNELLRSYEVSLALASIYKILSRNNVEPLIIYRRKKQYKRYQRPIPGDRIQMDTMKIRPGFYQYTAIDDCSRFRVLGLYKRRTSSNTLDFLERVIEEMPFPIQRIQTDRGSEFFALKVQEYLAEQSIKFRPIKPGSPHLNGKVERSQQTDIVEFYSITDVNADNLENLIEEWQFFYNWHRPHGALQGKTPIEITCNLLDKAPLWHDVYENYHAKEEPIKERNYQLEKRLRTLKRSV